MIKSYFPKVTGEKKKKKFCCGHVVEFHLKQLIAASRTFRGLLIINTRDATQSLAKRGKALRSESKSSADIEPGALHPGLQQNLSPTNISRAAPARKGEPARQSGSAKTLRIRGALSAANRWGSKSPRPAAGAAKPLRRIIHPGNLLSPEPAARCGRSVCGAVCNSPGSAPGTLQAARGAASCTPPNFGFPHHKLPDLLWFISSSPERTWS